MERPNLFSALLDFHPRECLTPKENFLTEAFAHILRVDNAALNCWVSILLGQEVEIASCEIETRRAESQGADESNCYPDMWIRGMDSTGREFEVLCEHKWDSPCSKAQLKKYGDLLAEKGPSARLCFVGSTQRQRADAITCLPRYQCFLWEDVFLSLKRVKARSAILKEFIDFMDNKGLSPGNPLTVSEMQAFLMSARFTSCLMRLAEKLNTDFDWTAIPIRYRVNPVVQDAWGRVGIRFNEEGFKPGISLGFLYDESDHGVTFINRKKGIDLLLRIEAYPKDTQNVQPAIEVLKAKRSALKKNAGSVLLKGESGNRNRYSLLIVRECLADVIEDAPTESAQLKAIYERLRQWLETLFGDGKLESAFIKSGLDGGLH